MKCECIYCIYNKKNLCILEWPEMNSMGMCEDCIVVTIPDYILETLKQKQLEEMESRFHD